MSTEPCSTEFFRKSNNLMNPLKFVKKGKLYESVHFDPSFWQHGITIMLLSFSMLVSCVSSLESVSCLGTSKKLSLGV